MGQMEIPFVGDGLNGNPGIVELDTIDCEVVALRSEIVALITEINGYMYVSQLNTFYRNNIVFLNSIKVTPYEAEIIAKTIAEKRRCLIALNDPSGPSESTGVNVERQPDWMELAANDKSH